ncbi:MAG: helix-turn-helix transcriptional regulator [Clostridia bacterium]
MKNNVKKYRELAGFTQDELSQKSEVSRNTISSLETGSNTNVTYDTMIKIAGALNKKVATIFFETKAQNIVQK